MPQVGNDPRNGSWDQEFEKNGPYRLPDCRVSYLERDNHRVRLSRIGLAWDIVYCAQCHQPKAASSPDCPHVFFICQECYDVMDEKHSFLEDIKVPGT
jgi:hypothetical protein